MGRGGAGHRTSAPRGPQRWAEPAPPSTPARMLDKAQHPHLSPVHAVMAGSCCGSVSHGKENPPPAGLRRAWSPAQGGGGGGGWARAARPLPAQRGDGLSQQITAGPGWPGGPRHPGHDSPSRRSAMAAEPGERWRGWDGEKDGRRLTEGRGTESGREGACAYACARARARVCVQVYFCANACARACVRVLRVLFNRALRMQRLDSDEPAHCSCRCVDCLRKRLCR